jgi:penicillin-binding protein 1A
MNEIAGKTGTTDNHSDGWFMGITPDLVSGVWVGAEVRSIHFEGIRLGQGANMALPVFANYIQKVYADSLNLNISTRDFDKPLRKFSFELDCDKANKKKPDNTNIIDDDSDFF